MFTEKVNCPVSNVGRADSMTRVGHNRGQVQSGNTGGQVSHLVLLFLWSRPCPALLRKPSLSKMWDLTKGCLLGYKVSPNSTSFQFPLCLVL